MNIRGTDSAALTAVTDLFVAPAATRDHGAPDFQRALSPPQPSEPVACSAPPPEAPARETPTQQAATPAPNQASDRPDERDNVAAAPVAAVADETAEQVVAETEETVSEPSAEAPVDEEEAESSEEAAVAFAVATTVAVDQTLPQQTVPLNPELTVKATIAEDAVAIEGDVVAVAETRRPESTTTLPAEELPVAREALIATETTAAVAIEQNVVAIERPAEVAVTPTPEQSSGTGVLPSALQSQAASNTGQATHSRTPPGRAGATAEERAKYLKSSAEPATSVQTQAAASTEAASAIVAAPAPNSEDRPERKTKQFEQPAINVTSTPTFQQPSELTPTVEPKADPMAVPAEAPIAAELPSTQQPAPDSAKPTTTQPLSNQAITQRLPAHAVVRTTPQQPAPPPLHVDAARFLQRVTKAFEAAHERGGEIRLRLSPPELGALRVEVKLTEQGMTARVEVENHDARTVLLENLSALRERLAEQGIRLEKFDVDLSQREPDQQANREFSEQPRDKPAARETRSVRSPLNPTQTPATNTTTPPTSGWHDRQLNVIV